jgi:two-component system LytT family sensor kinase
MATVSFDPLHGEALEGEELPAELHRHRSRSIMVLTLIFWCSNFLLLTLSTALAEREHLAQITAIRLLTTLLGLFFCFLIHRLLRRISTIRRRLIALAILAPVAAEIFAWAAFFAEATVDPAVNLGTLTWGVAVRTVTFWTWYFLAWAGFYLALTYSFDFQNEQRRTAEVREQAHVAQLRALHSQINPHFLFNSLNSVSSLILDRKVDEADEMVNKLARFLRLGLGADPMQIIALSTELELQRAYLEIEQLRYEDLTTSFTVPTDLGTALVPALILQPIVENAIKHGVASAVPPARIEIRAWRDAERIHLEVTDSGKGQERGRTGKKIGLANVRQRLSLMYGEENSALAAGRLKDGRYRVEVSFPVEFE